jgi:hypothetical protein
LSGIDYEWAKLQVGTFRGAFGKYLWRVFDQLSGRPEWVIEKEQV